LSLFFVSWIEPGTTPGYLFLFVVSLLVFFVVIAFFSWIVKWLAQQSSFTFFTSRRTKEPDASEDEPPL
jgi:hypothetical protein